jgi:hypothetical protein
MIGFAERNCTIFIPGRQESYILMPTEGLHITLLMGQKQLGIAPASLCGMNLDLCQRG